MSNKYEPTSSGYKEIDAEHKDKAAITEAVTPSKKVSATQQEAGKGKKGKKDKASAAEKKSDANLAIEVNTHIPYPSLGGHTVSQLAGMETHKRKAILADKDDEFVNKYM